jgi:hypothetical protein
MFTIVLSRPTMNRLDEQITSTSRRRRRLSCGSGITPPDGISAIACLQLTISVRDRTQGHPAETFVTEPRFPVLIIFYVAFCMKPAQAKQNEASKMRVTSPREETE